MLWVIIFSTNKLDFETAIKIHASGLKVNLCQDKTFIGIDYPAFTNYGIYYIFLRRPLLAGFEDRIVYRQSVSLPDVAALTAGALTQGDKAKMGAIPWM